MASRKPKRKKPRPMTGGGPREPKFLQDIILKTKGMEDAK